VSALLELAAAFVEDHPREASRLLDTLEVPAITELLASCPPRAAARCLENVAPVLAAECLAAWPEPRRAALVEGLSDGSLAALLRRVEPARRESLTASLPDSRAAKLRFLLAYPEGSAGALMSTRPLALSQDRSVGEVRAIMRRGEPDTGDVYVVAPDGALDGVVSLARLAAATDSVLLRDLMLPPAAMLPPTMPVASLAEHPAWGSARTLPVVDEAVGFVGSLPLETVEQLELERHRPAAHPAVSLTMALGELYWHMASGLVGAVGPRGRAPLEDER
jgi:magnesium transporter